MTKATIFPGVMYGCKNWTAKKAECQRIDAFKLWYWRRLLRVPWTARRSNQSVLKEINPEYSLERLKAEGEGTTENEMVGWHHQLNRHEFEQALGDGERQGSLVCCSPWSRKESDMTE